MKGSNYQVDGLYMMPCASLSVGGNWLALSGPFRRCRYQDAEEESSKLRFALGSITPTVFPNVVFTMEIGN